MRKLVSILMLFSSFALAEDSPQLNSKYGYSYFTVGMESVSYQERYGSTSSKATAVSPVINSGSLTRVNDRFDFSIDALATFSPGSTDEKWYDGQGVIQENKFEYIKTATNVLIHYKVTPQLRVVAGPSMTYQTYKRYQNQNESAIFYGTWEESSSDVFINAGLSYDKGTLFSDSRWHFYFKAVGGVPIWSQAANTAIDGVTFNPFGFRASIDAGINYQVMEGIHLGWFLMANYEKRFEEGPVFWRHNDEGKRQFATLPEAETKGISTGLQILWSL